MCEDTLNLLLQEKIAAIGDGQQIKPMKNDMNPGYAPKLQGTGNELLM